MSYTKTPFYYMVDASVGSGKTTAAIKMIVDGPPSQNYLYVVPTLVLSEQVCDDLGRAVTSGQSIERIDSTRARGMAVLPWVKNEINGTIAGMGRVLLVTTPTFIDVVADINNKDDWIVILDEAFAPFTMTDLQWGTSHSRDMITDLFKEGRDGSLQAVDRSLVTRIANGTYAEDCLMAAPCAVALSKAVLNKALFCSWVGLGDKQGSFASYVKPSAMQGFEAVYFMAALFKNTILYHLWTNPSAGHPVTFIENKQFQVSGNMIDVHDAQGPNVLIGHLLHPNDNASKTLLYRNATTGEQWDDVGSRIIDRCLDIAIRRVGSGRLLWTANNGYEALGIQSKTKDGTLVRAEGDSRGSNHYLDHVNAVALAATNPTPQQSKWLVEHTGLSRDEVQQAFSIHSIYQFFGRTAIRVRGNTKPVLFMCAGRRDALFLHELFKGSTFIGQIGKLKSAKTLPQYHKPKAKVVRLKDDVEYQCRDKRVRSLAARAKRNPALLPELEEAKAWRKQRKAELKAA